MNVFRSLALGTAIALCAAPVLADGGVTFQDVADDPTAGIDYGRTPSDRDANRQAFIDMFPLTAPQYFDLVRSLMPMKGDGAPGVALLDYDNDGDLDIYATNGPGTANSLFQNQLDMTGAASFVDVAAAAGVTATAQDSSGVCFGDVDNDGDSDLYVVSSGDGNLLFVNNGDGTFTDGTATAGVAGDGRFATGCAMADVDNDGLLDLIVANAYDWTDRLATSNVFYEFLQHNYLFMNQGGNVFTDESAARGFEDLDNLDLPGTSGAGWTWALTAVDHDQDGDVDILFLDNQSGFAATPEQERGWLRLMENDGTGHFTDATVAHHLDEPGGWMGVDYGDFNCDGYLDFFTTEIGYLAGAPSRWFNGSASGEYVDSGAGDLNMTPFGWGTSVLDYDNDGDADVIYHGGMDMGNVTLIDNAGALLVNEGQCSGDFDRDAAAILKDHRSRTVEGVAVGDLNNDGFEDIVSVAGFDIDLNAASVVLLVNIFGPAPSPFDTDAALIGNLGPGLTWAGPEHLPGSLSVEINSGGNGNGSVNIVTFGGAGLASGAINNRDGIGAVVSFTPVGGPTSIRPIAAGSSYASQDALAAHFGLGVATTGTVDVLWPGGVRNRLYDVAAGETVLFPEIPCSFDGEWNSKQDFRLCVRDALKSYRHPSVGVVSNPDGFKRFEESMLRAYDEAQ